MNPIPYLLSVFLMVMISCERSSEVDLDPPDFQMNEFTIDIDQDQNADFAVVYRHLATTDFPSSSQSHIGSIVPLNGNQVLYRANIGYLFLEFGDVIRIGMNENGVWMDYSADVISISIRRGNVDPAWTIQSNRTSDFILGFKMTSEGIIKIGWMRLGLDRKTGAISVLDIDVSTSDELLITD